MSEVPNYRVALEERQGDRGEDRVGVFRGCSSLILAVADGAGGTGSGAFAANAVIEQADFLAGGVCDSPAMALMTSEQAMYSLGGQSTGIIAVVAGTTMHGASVGDSECWWLVEGGFVDLTAGQSAKPLLGDGGMPVAFGPFPATGRLLLATDGLFNYVSAEQVLAVAAQPSIDDAARQLADLPRLPNGDWPDDVGLIMVDLEHDLLEGLGRDRLSA